MAQIRYRANLSAKDFVFSSQDWGRSVVLKQYDQNFSRQIVSPTDPDKDIGIPQIFYGHNIMPSAQGFQSVGIKEILANTGISAPKTAVQVLKWVSTNSFGYFAITFVSSIGGVSNTYDIYSYSPGISSQWNLLQQVTVPIGTVTVNAKFTAATVNGLTYVYAPGQGCYSYDGTTWAAVTLTGLTANQISGITESFGYMLAWSPTTVAWSSTLTPTDFTPSLITGAGGGSIQGLKGQITYINHHVFGFVAFSEFNCVAAVYSGNARYPFNFREIVGGGGISGSFINTVSLDSETGNLYAFTTAGLQIVSVTQAQVVFPELTNFIAGSRFEDFNDATLQFISTDVTYTGGIYKQVTVVANRYLVISYGIQYTLPITYTHALVYDIAMKRWGKIKFTHIQPIEFTQAANQYIVGTQDQARASLCFMDPSCNIWQIDFSQVATSGGTIILGKYQHARDRLITLDQVDIEYCPQSNNLPAINIFPTLDGKTFQAPVALTPLAATSAPQYPTRTTGMNVSVCIQGIFRLDSLMLIYHSNGRR